LLKQGLLKAEAVLTAARQGGKRIVVAVDAQAAELGLAPGMAVAQAQAMQPDLRIEEADPAGDAAGLTRLAGWCLRHISPLAAPSAPDGVWIDVTGCTHLFGGETALLSMLAGRLAQAGFCARAAVADTPGAAHALARFGGEALVVDAPGGVRESLAPLPVAALRLPDEVLVALRRLGFERVGDVMKAPRAPLAKRFGGLVLRRLDQALGVLAEPIEPLLVAEIPRARMGFLEPISTPDDLARATGMLAERVCDKLLQRGLGVLQLDLVFGRVDGASQVVRVGTAAAGCGASDASAGAEDRDGGSGFRHRADVAGGNAHRCFGCATGAFGSVRREQGGGSVGAGGFAGEPAWRGEGVSAGAGGERRAGAERAACCAAGACGRRGVAGGFAAAAALVCAAAAGAGAGVVA
jgi:hypothetical protein